MVRTRRGKVERAVVDWVYNAWGGKYPPYGDDDAIPTRIAWLRKIPLFYPGIVMEGGSVDSNGTGMILTTACCLLNKNRNPNLTPLQIERYLKAFYSQQRVAWLENGIAGDDTDGHVDDVARFISPTKLVVAVESDPRDVNYAGLRENLRLAKSLKDYSRRYLEVIELPMPGVVEHRGRRLPATYANFYFVNGALLVPTFGQQRSDQNALAILQKHLPRRKVIGIDCTRLILGRGAIHCLTQQEPPG